MLMFRYEHDHESKPVTDLLSFSITPPSRVICLSHWQILSALTNLLDPGAQQSLLCYENYILRSGDTFLPETFSDPPIKFVDTHFHLDALLSRGHYSTLTAMEVSTPTSDQFCLSVAVANYVFPAPGDTCHCNLGLIPEWCGLWASIHGLLTLPLIFLVYVTLFVTSWLLLVVLVLAKLVWMKLQKPRRLGIVRCKSSLRSLLWL